MRNFVLFLTQLFLVSNLVQAATFSQVKIGPSTPQDPSSALEVQSTTQYSLFPRMTTSQKNAISSPQNGAVVFDTTLQQFSGYEGGQWAPIGASIPAAGIVTSNGSTLGSVTDPLPVGHGGTSESSQTTNGITYFDGTHLTTSASFNWNGTDFGVGISSPHAPISLLNSTGDKIYLYDAGIGSSFGLGIATNLFQVFTDTSSSDIAFGYGGSSSAFTRNVTFKGTGDVLIGTVTDSSKLTVNGTVTASGYANTSLTNNKVIVSSGGAYTELSAGSTGQVVTQGSSSVGWATPAAGNFAVSQNILTNPGFETSTANWSVTGGTLSYNTTAANVGSGVGSAKWIISASSQTFSSSAYATLAGLYGQNGAGSCTIQGATQAHTLQVYDTTTSTALASTTIPASTVYDRTTVNFIFPSTNDTLELQLISAGSDTVYIDDCYLGNAAWFNVGSSNLISQGTAYTPTYGGYGTVTGSQVFYRQVGDTVEMWGTFTPGSPTSAPGTISLPNGLTIDSNKLSSSQYNLVGNVATNDGNSTTVVLFMIAEGGQSAITLSRRYGPNSDTPLTPEDVNVLLFGSIPISFYAKVPVVQFAGAPTIYNATQTGNNWSGYQEVNSGCTTLTSGGYQDPTSCVMTLTQLVNNNFGTVVNNASGLAGIDFTPARLGTVMVCSQVNWVNGGANPAPSARLVDGSGNIINPGLQGRLDYGFAPLCGLYQIGSLGTTTFKIQTYPTASSGTNPYSGNPPGDSLFWTIFYVDSALPAPLLVNSVVNDALGVTKTYYGQFDLSGCTVNVSSVSGVTCTTDTTGNFHYVLPSGVFSATPICTCSAYQSSGVGLGLCMVDSAVAATSTQVHFSFNLNGSANNGVMNVQCIGPH